jgi:hypothetical protein
MTAAYASSVDNIKQRLTAKHWLTVGHCCTLYMQYAVQWIILTLAERWTFLYTVQ